MSSAYAFQAELRNLGPGNKINISLGHGSAFELGFPEGFRISPLEGGALSIADLKLSREGLTLAAGSTPLNCVLRLSVLTQIAPYLNGVTATNDPAMSLTARTGPGHLVDMMDDWTLQFST